MLVTRNAEVRDLGRIAQVESLVWSEEGTEIYGEDRFRTWLDVYPDGFWVAEERSMILGFSYVQAVPFGPHNRDALTTFNEITDNGYTRRTHDPSGSYHFGVSMCSLVRGGGRLLLDAVLEFSRRTGRPLFGSSRIPGFAAYLDSARKNRCHADKDVVALSYVLGCVKISRGKTWKGFPNSDIPPVLDFPLIQDPVLGFYLSNPELGLYSILSGFMQDPKSHDLSVLFGQEI